MAATLAELARRFEARLRGAGELQISSVAALDRAGPGQISYLSDSRYRRHLATTRAAALILTEDDAKGYAGNALIVDRPQLCFARVAAFLHPRDPMRPGIHASALVDPHARISARASIGPYAIVEAGAVVGEEVEIGAGCYVGRDADIGAGTRAIGHVWIGERTVIGKRCLLHPGAVIGGDGFGFAKDGDRWVKIPQLGRVVIGDDVEIGANTTIDRGTLSDTEIGDGVKLDNLVQIAHNVRIGEHSAMAACVGVAGSSVIGRRCTFGGQVGIADHVTIADDVHVLGTSLVAASIGAPGVYSAAIPAEPANEWRRQAARLRHLDELVQRVKALEVEINKLKEDST
jgi:UDP-3-O-[3-hydroxymyristoyl] glucosamine N-acyltransferase